MQQLPDNKTGWLKSTFAGLMAALVLLLALFASSESLHHKLHQDSAGHHHGPCAVCSVAQGQLESPGATVSEVFAEPSCSWTLPIFTAVAPHEGGFSVASSRGPPVPTSSL